MLYFYKLFVQKHRTAPIIAETIQYNEDIIHNLLYDRLEQQRQAAHHSRIAGYPSIFPL